MGMGALIGGSVLSSVVGASSANRAADAQADAAADANETQRYIFDTNVALQEPWLDAGTEALAEMRTQLGLAPYQEPTQEQPAQQQAGQQNALATLPEGWRQYGNGYTNGMVFSSGIPGNGTSAAGGPGGTPGAPVLAGGEGAPMTGMPRPGNLAEMSASHMPAQTVIPTETTGATGTAETAATTGDDRYGAFQATPGYQWSVDQGMEALDRGASARGLRLSGAALQEAQDYQTGLANQEYGNYYNRLAGLAGVGQSAVNATQNAGTQYANAYGSNALAAGNARASGYQGVNDAFQGGMNNLFSIVGMNQAGYFD